MAQGIYKRETYLKGIRGFYNTDLIIVITGIRGCGKTCLLQSVRDELIETGVADKDIIYINMEGHGYKGIHTPDRLEKAIDSRIADNDRKYIFIDEVQRVKDFEPLINGYREKGHSLFIAGSGSVLDGEQITKLVGRYIEIELFTLSFYEYEEMKEFLSAPKQDLMSEFTEYIRCGGFPETLQMNDDAEKAECVRSILKDIYEKDITSRGKVRDSRQFDETLSYALYNYGSLLNCAKAARQLNELGCAIKAETVRRYMDLLLDAKVAYECPRYDHKSKASLPGGQRLYLADLSLCDFAPKGGWTINYGPVMGNILYCYLRGKGYKVCVDAAGTFVARKGQDMFYCRVAETISDKETEDEEYNTLLCIKDNYPKYIFTLDPLMQKRAGILHRNMADFMRKNEDL